MPKKKFNGKRVGYKISYYPVGRSWKIRNLSVNYRTNYTELTANLTVFTEYVITVSAVSSGGVGPGNTIIARTGDAGTVIYLRMLCLMQSLECYYLFVNNVGRPEDKMFNSRFGLFQQSALNVQMLCSSEGSMTLLHSAARNFP